MRLLRLLAASAIVVCATGATLAEDQSSQTYQNLLTPILKGSTDVLGAPLAYPDGPATVTTAIVTIPPGGSTGWHHHEVPLFAYILEGELTVEYKDRGPRSIAPARACWRRSASRTTAPTTGPRP